MICKDDEVWLRIVKISLKTSKKVKERGVLKFLLLLIINI